VGEGVGEGLGRGYGRRQGQGEGQGQFCGRDPGLGKDWRYVTARVRFRAGLGVQAALGSGWVPLATNMGLWSVP